MTDISHDEPSIPQPRKTSTTPRPRVGEWMTAAPLGSNHAGPAPRSPVREGVPGKRKRNVDHLGRPLD